MKHCPICNKDLQLGDFGKCKARKDGKNLYCKSCINNKVRESRKSIKEYTKAKRRRSSLPLFDAADAAVIVPLSRLADRERVRVVLQGEGCKTQKQIADDAKLSLEVVDLWLAQMIVDRAVCSAVEGGKRLYWLPPAVAVAKTERKPMQLSTGFSQISGLWPGRSSVTERKAG